MSGDNPQQHTDSSMLAARQGRLRKLMDSEPAVARERYMSLLREAQECHLGTEVAKAYINITSCYFREGNYRKMVEYAQKGLEASRDTGLPHSQSQALNHLGLAHQRLGMLDIAAEYFYDSLTLSQEHADASGVERALANFAMLYNKMGAYEESLDLYEKTLALYKASGVASRIAIAYGGVMENLYLLGRDEECLELAIQAIAFSRDNATARAECFARSILAQCLLRLGRAQAAIGCALAGYRVATWASDKESQAELKWVEAEARIVLADFDAAESCLLTSLALQKDSQHVDYLRRTHRSLYVLYCFSGDVVRAGEHARTAQQLDDQLSDMGLTAVTLDAVDGPELEELASHFPRPSLMHSVDSIAASVLEKSRAEIERHAVSHSGPMPRREFTATMSTKLTNLDPNECIGYLQVSVSGLRVIARRFGQATVTSLLQDVHSRLVGALRPGDKIGLVGGDEFGLVLTDLAEPDDIEIVAAKVATVLADSFHIRGEQLDVDCFVAALVAPRDGVTVEELVSRGDMTVQHAIATGSVGYVLYHPEVTEPETRRRTLVYDLRGALERNEFSVQYQAYYRVETKRIAGFEALLRWDHPTLGRIGPDEFIPLAEQGRQILDIGDWVLRQACADVAEWRKDRPDIAVAVNVSRVQIAMPDFATEVLNVLNENHLAPDSLVVELTETVMMQDESTVLSHVDQLRQQGVQTAVDDFGTGYSSLALLQDFPVETLKIDKSFFRGPEKTESRRKTLVSTMVMMATELGLSVVAEGVEKQEEFDFLASLNCTFVQGYLLHKPSPAAQAAALLSQSQVGSPPQQYKPSVDLNEPSLRTDS